MTLDQSRFIYKDGTYIAEASDLGSAFRSQRLPYELTVDGLLFTYSHADYSGGDVAGWWWETRDRENKVLIIND